MLDFVTLLLHWFKYLTRIDGNFGTGGTHAPRATILVNVDHVFAIVGVFFDGDGFWASCRSSLSVILIQSILTAGLVVVFQITLLWEKS